jgi:hypothetical protein
MLIVSPARLTPPQCLNASFRRKIGPRAAWRSAHKLVRQSSNFFFFPHTDKLTGSCRPRTFNNLSTSLELQDSQQPSGQVANRIFDTTLPFCPPPDVTNTVINLDSCILITVKN